MRTIHVFLFLSLSLLAGLIGLAGCGKPAGGDQGNAQHSRVVAVQKYHCPMHPTYIIDKLSDCPICGMKLVPIADSGGAKESATERVAAPGRTGVMLSADRRQLIGLTLSKVEKRSFSLTVRATGVLQHDETRYARIAPRFGGWVRKLNINYTGAPVEKGQPLFTAYSPELFSTESDYLIAWRAVQQIGDATPVPQRESARVLLEAARTRLALMEVAEEEIHDLETRGAASQELVYRAPFSGHVLSKTAVEGKSFMAGDTLYEIADLSQLWLQASVAITDLPLLAVGQEATVTFPMVGNLTVTAPITFLDPHLDPQTRRGNVRIELENPGQRLRPEMWADVEIEIPLGEKLTIPAAAVIDTGKRYIAFVGGADDRLDPRVLKIRAKTDEYYEVVDGVVEGDQVVNRALFLVDSESQLQAAISAMAGEGGHKH
jgi:Cu(I)/Ag(I) efflux system membrane fusion protein